MRGYKSIHDRPLGTFYKPTKGFFNENRDWTVGEPTPFEVFGDMQPIPSRARKQLEAPQGFTLRDAKYLSTKQCLSTVDDVEGRGADYTIINGREFYVWSECDWSGTNTPTSFYKDYVLVMKRLSNG